MPAHVGSKSQNHLGVASMNIVQPNGQPVVSQQQAIAAMATQQFHGVYLGLVVSIAGRPDSSVDDSKCHQAICDAAFSLAKTAMAKLGVTMR